MAATSVTSLVALRFLWALAGVLALVGFLVLIGVVLTQTVARATCRAPWLSIRETFFEYLFNGMWLGMAGFVAVSTATILADRRELAAAFATGGDPPDWREREVVARSILGALVLVASTLLLGFEFNLLLYVASGNVPFLVEVRVWPGILVLGLTAGIFHLCVWLCCQRRVELAAEQGARLFTAPVQAGPLLDDTGRGGDQTPMEDEAVDTARGEGRAEENNLRAPTADAAGGGSTRWAGSGAGADDDDDPRDGAAIAVPMG